jgi:hypothetical protein
LTIIVQTGAAFNQLLLGKPPVLPGDSQSITIQGLKENLLTVNRSKATRKEVSVEQQPEFSHMSWECKYPAVWITEYRMFFSYALTLFL